MLSKLQLKNVCLLNGGTKQCRYLSEDDLQYGVYYCQKLRPIQKDRIDKEIKETIEYDKKRGVDPADQNYPLGDNCGGYPLLRYKEQGYDV